MVIRLGHRRAAHSVIKTHTNRISVAATIWLSDSHISSPLTRPGMMGRCVHEDRNCSLIEWKICLLIHEAKLLTLSMLAICTPFIYFSFFIESGLAEVLSGGMNRQKYAYFFVK